MATLYWKFKGQEDCKEKDLDPEAEVSIGRSKDNDVCLLDPHLSRHHAKICHKDGAFHLVDLNSRNGTNVNGELIMEHELQPGDEIQLGEAVIRFDSPFSEARAGDETLPELAYLEGPESGQSVKLHDRGFFAGRKSGNDLVLNDFRVSGKHCRIEKKSEDVYLVEDCTSKNGTYINGQRITTGDLCHGDVLSVGGVKLRFQFPGRPLPEAPPPPPPSSPAAEALEKPAAMPVSVVPDAAPQKQWFLNIVLAVALTAIVCAGYGAAVNLFSGPQGETPERGNKVGDFFSFEEGGEAPDGWTAKAGVSLKRQSGGLPPGMFAAQVKRTDGENRMPAIVKYHEPVSVEPGKTYALKGYCAIKGEGAGCLAVKWMGSENSESMQYGEVCRSGRSAMISTLFRCPQRMQSAEVYLVVFGGAEAVFDQIAFQPVDADTAGTGREGSEPATAAQSQRTLQAGDFTLSVHRNGPFDLLLKRSVEPVAVLRKCRLQVAGAVAGLPGESLGSGAVFQADAGVPSDGGASGLVMARRVFLPERNDWLSLQKNISLHKNGGEVTWKIKRDAMRPDMRIAYVFGLPEDLMGGDKRFSVYGPLGKRDVTLGELAGLKMRELIIKSLPGRLVIRFPGVCTVLRQGDVFVVYVEQEIDAEVKQNWVNFTLAWSFKSMFEEAFVSRTLVQSEKLAETGREGEAIVLLENLLKAHTPTKLQKADIQKRIQAHREAGAGCLAQADAMNALLSRTGDPSIQAALLDYLKGVQNRYQGCDDITRKAAQIVQALSSDKQASKQRQTAMRLDGAFEEARKLFTLRRYATAYILARQLLKDAEALAGNNDKKAQIQDFLSTVELRLTNKAYLPPLLTKEADQ